MADVGTFTTYPALADLPPLVKRQRTLEGKIAPLALLVEDEKAVRHAIDALLLKAGFEKGDSVTCNGYDVAHIERVGTSRLNQDVLTESLAAKGLPRPWIAQTIADCTETGAPSQWATVKPSKGSKVRK